MTLERRLSLLCAVAVAATVLLVSAVAYVAARGALRGQIDDSLRAQARAVQLRGLPDSGVPRVVGEPPARTGLPQGFFQYVRPDGTAVPLRGDEPRIPVTEADRKVAAGTGAPQLSDRRSDGVHLRVLTVPLAGGGAVELARSLASVDRVLDRLRIVLLGLCGIGTALAAGLSRLFSRRLMRPVADLTAAAGHIEATGDLDRRIDTARGDELGRLAQRFNAMLDRLGATQAALGASLDSQRRLIADASHELRTPVTSLRTNAEVLRDGRGLTDADRDALLGDVVVQAEELGELVADIIELARDGDDGAAVEEVRLDLLVAEACERAHRHAPGVRFETALAPCVVEAVPDRLGRAVNNLLDNAAKHSPPDGVVEVGVRDGELTVRDHGAGVAAADAPHVFDRFYRGANARGRPGSGLGLAIVRQVAEAHGGRAAVEAAAGGGALFRLSLPSRPVAAGGEPSPEGARRDMTA
ncbi:MAG: two-component system, OmpR family, sensor histidine kinase MprB [Solirubrobacteraceae bacterium]|nr:two-component system, OmpR family, sensor histidine kinase MprB [Solirubrobacteraceae bacterium]